MSETSRSLATRITALDWARARARARDSARIVELLPRRAGRVEIASGLVRHARSVMGRIARNAANKVLTTFGTLAADQPELERTEIEIKYGRPRNPNQARLLEVIQTSRLIEDMADNIRNR